MKRRCYVKSLILLINFIFIAPKYRKPLRNFSIILCLVFFYLKKGNFIIPEERFLLHEKNACDYEHFIKSNGIFVITNKKCGKLIMYNPASTRIMKSKSTRKLIHKTIENTSNYVSQKKKKNPINNSA